MKHLKADGVIHCEAAQAAGEFFLCGFSANGERGDILCEETAAAINCRDCIAIIVHCQSIRRGEFQSTRRAQR